MITNNIEVNKKRKYSTDDNDTYDESDWRLSVMERDLDKIQKGINKGMDVNVHIDCNGYYYSPLQWICKENTRDSDIDFLIIKLLIKAKADVNDNKRYAPLHEACDQYNPSLRVVQLLVESGANVQLIDKSSYGSILFVSTLDKHT